MLYCQFHREQAQQLIWHLCIALDLAVEFKLLSGIYAWIYVWVHVQLGSSGHIAPSKPMTSIDQLGSNLGLGLTFLFPNPHYNLTFGSFDLVSSLVWWEVETNIKSFAVEHIVV